MNGLIDIIENSLQTAFAPSILQVEDESHLHAGHAGAAEHATEHAASQSAPPSHVHIAITSDALAPLSRLARHRAVMDAIAPQVELIHALRLTINPD